MWAFPRRCGSWRRRVGFRCRSESFRRPEEAAGSSPAREALGPARGGGGWFEDQLRGPEGTVAREYLAGRGLTPEGIKVFRIGYAPDSFHALEERLRGMADEETLRASGLFSSKEQGDGSQGPIYDRFRKRVMFPIANESGRVIAFTARTLERGKRLGQSTSIRRRRRSYQRARCSSIWTRRSRRSGRRGMRCWWKGRWTVFRCSCGGFST